MKKGIMTILAIVLICVIGTSVPAKAEEQTEISSSQTTYENATLNKKGRLVYKNVYYSLVTDEDGETFAVVTGGKAGKSKYNVPAKIYYEDIPYQVLKIENEAFAGSELKSIALPDCIEEIGDMAFISCENLEKITVPKQCQTIGIAAFMSCTNLKKVDFGNGYLHEIKDAAFAMSGVENITLSIITDSIGASCFSGCQNLNSITFGANCDYVGEGAFTDCPSLKKFSKVKMNGYLVIENGCIYSKSKKILYSAALATGDVVLREGTEAILPYSFENNTNITSITIPATVKEIPEGCFINCSNLKDVIIEKGVEVIGENSFYNCKRLSKITIPATVNEIVDNPFLYCSKLSSVSVNSKNTAYMVKSGMLIRKSDNVVIAAPGAKGEITLYSGCKGIEPYAFAYNKKITKLTVNNKLKKIDTAAFIGCKNLKYIYFPNRKVDLSASEKLEDGSFCGIFGGTSAELEVSLPYSPESGASGSIESNVLRHCGRKIMLTQH